MATLIAVTGGIGSGKSAVCRCLMAWGLRVYDCDSRAKQLMDASPEIHEALCREISPEVVKNGMIDRPLLASIVFGNPDKLARLNRIVHGCVRADIIGWKQQHSDERLLFVETAILLESNLHMIADEVWLVDAPRELRLARAVARDNAEEEKIRRRIESQRDICQADVEVPFHIINNDGIHAILPQLQQLLEVHGISINSLPGQWKN